MTHTWTLERDGDWDLRFIEELQDIAGKLEA